MLIRSQKHSGGGYGHSVVQLAWLLLANPASSPSSSRSPAQWCSCFTATGPCMALMAAALTLPTPAHSSTHPTPITRAPAEAVSMLLRFGEACDSGNARSSQCKAYLGAVVVWLYAENPKEAWQVGGRVGGAVA